MVFLNASFNPVSALDVPLYIVVNITKMLLLSRDINLNHIYTVFVQVQYASGMDLWKLT